MVRVFYRVGCRPSDRFDHVYPDNDIAITEVDGCVGTVVGHMVVQKVPA
jgi:hypothetical protein